MPCLEPSPAPAPRQRTPHILHRPAQHRRPASVTFTVTLTGGQIPLGRPIPRGGLPLSACARQAGTRICQDEEFLRDFPVLARLVKRSPNELLGGTSLIN